MHISIESPRIRLLLGIVFLGAALIGMGCSDEDDAIGNGHNNPPTPQKDRVIILHTNDMHDQLIGFGPNGEYTPLAAGDDTTVGGIARVAGKVKEVRAERDEEGIPTLLVDAGDFMMGTAFEFLRGEAELGVMNAMGYDVITLGNHEFDWKPASTAAILSHAAGLPVVASNLVFSPDHPGDDELEALYNSGVIKPYFIKELSNGLKVGFFGLVGKDAAEVAPFAYPVEFADPAGVAQSMVESLNAQGANLIVCLSHSGLEEDSGLAAAVPGIDVIISGHTHETAEEPILVGTTVIVQAGAYTKTLGILDLKASEEATGVMGYELVNIDDSILGDAATQTFVEDCIDKLDTQVLAPMGYSFDQVLAETQFDMILKEEENNLGNMVADSIRWMVDQYEYDPEDPSTKVDFAIESNGVIRDDILQGTTGAIAFSDAFRVLPLGFGLDGAVGYPMVTIYVTAEEVKKAMEVITTVYPLKGSDYWLNISGLRFEYAKRGIPFVLVRNIYVGDDENGYSDVPLDTSPANTELYKIAINYYVAQFIAVVGDYTYGILTIIPKDKDGVSYLDEVAHPGGIDEALVDTNPDVPGIQGLQEWKGFLDYLATFEDTDEDGIPNIPERYQGPTGRIVQVPCFVATVAYGSVLEPRVGILRSFRDRVLDNTEWGRTFTEAYYTYGKHVASWIQERQWLCALTRILLLPFIGIAKVALLFCG